MGRPLGIQDADIDVEVRTVNILHFRNLHTIQLPMDVDFSDDDDTALRTLSEKDMVAPSSPCEPPASQKPITSMTSALHIIKCRQIESEIQRVMYRVDRAGNNSEIAQEASRLLGRLDRCVLTADVNESVLSVSFQVEDEHSSETRRSRFSALL